MREVGDRHGEAKSLKNLGNVALDRGELEAAEQYHEQSLAIEREVGDRHGEAMSLHLLGSTAAMVGNYEEAVEYVTEAFDLYTETGAIRNVVQAADFLAWLADERGNPEEALEWCDRGLELIENSSADLSDAESRLRTRRDEIENPNEPSADALYRKALRAAAIDEDDHATPFFHEAWDQRESLDPNSEEYSLALSAGVGLLAEITLLDLEETTDAEENITSEIRPVRDRLTVPAEVLLEVLTTDSEDELPEELADAPAPDEAESLTDLEAAAYRALLDRLRAPKTHPPHEFDPEPSFEEATQPGVQLMSD